MTLVFHDRDGNEISIERFAELLADIDYRRIKQEHIRGWFVSTVWLPDLATTFGDGMPTWMFLGGPYETMIHAPEDEGGDWVYQVRHPTVKAAEEGHAQAVAWLLERIGPEVEMDEGLAALAAEMNTEGEL